MAKQFVNALRPATVLASAVPALLGGSGCKVDEELGFRISDIQFDGERTITLTFSEPLENFDGLNPNDFRISLAQTAGATFVYEGMSVTYEYTSYRDIAFELDYDYYGDGRLDFVSAMPGASANQIVLEAETSFAIACEVIDATFESFQMYGHYYQNARFDMTMFLHYAAGDIPIESTATGSVLQDIGPDWVLNTLGYYGRMSFGFTQLAPQLRIPCP